MNKHFASGFSMFEVLVALVITAVGLLGIAKMQALSYSSTGSASVRSLVAMEVAGLAAAMHANRAYWATASAPTAFTITNATNSDNTLNTTATAADYCLSGGGTSKGTACSPAELAAFDLHTYANALNTALPNSTSTTTITCPVSQPVNCKIWVRWTEKTVAINTQGNTAMIGPDYTLYVQP